MPRRKDCIINDSITDALFILLKQKSANEITIIELIKKAGVSRNSFYRNFMSIEDIAYKYFMIQSRLWWNEQIQQKKVRDMERIVQSLFEYLYSIKEKIVLCYEKGLSAAFIRHVFDCAAAEQNLLDKKQCYYIARVSGLICGIMNEWVKGKMTDSPEHVASFLNPQNAYNPLNSNI